jgi:hypothetical protein
MPRRCRFGKVLTSCSWPASLVTQAGWWSILTYLLPFLLFLGFWIFLMRNVRQGERGGTLPDLAWSQPGLAFSRKRGEAERAQEVPDPEGEARRSEGSGQERAAPAEEREAQAA